MEKIIKYECTLEHRLGVIGISKLAIELGVTHSAVWQMIRNGRQIYLRKTRGKWEYAEVKPFKRGQKAA